MAELALGELRVAARYPFTSAAREFVKSLNLSLEGIMAHPLYSACVELGERRVAECVEGRFNPAVGDELECKLAVLSYPVARMIANSMGSRPLLERYASGEAHACARFLDSEDNAVVASIVKELDLDYDGRTMGLVKFIHLSADLAKKTPRWKLLSRSVESGRVEADENEVRTLMREAIREEVKKPVEVKNIPDELRRRTKGLRSLLTPERHDIKIEKVDENALPPCVKAMVAMLEQGAASHNAMFVLATFFSNLGLGVEETVNIFRRSPKFKEELTRYQIEFLSGEKSNTEYTCPTCVTIKSWGLCRWECPVKHPIQYYRNNAKTGVKVIKKEADK